MVCSTLRLGLGRFHVRGGLVLMLLPVSFLTDLLGIQRALWQQRRGEFCVEMQELQGNRTFIRLLGHFWDQGVARAGAPPRF